MGDTESWEQQEGLECHHKAGGAGSVTTKQEGLEVSPQSRSQSQETPSVTPAASLSIFVKVLRLEQSLPPLLPFSLPPSPALAGIIKTPRDGCKLLDVFMKTNQSIFPCGIIALEPTAAPQSSRPRLDPRLCLLPAISLDYPWDGPLS